MRPFCMTLAALPILAACGSTVIEQTSSVGSGGGRAGTSTGSGATSTGSGFGTGSTGSGFGGGFTTSGAGGESPACADAHIDIQPSNGSLEHLVGSCPGWGAQQSSRPVAYFLSGGAFAGTLVLRGCLDSQSGAPAIDMTGLAIDAAMPSSSPASIGDYVDPLQHHWSGAGLPAQMTITKMAAKSGETVEGSFTGDVTGDNGSLSLSGTFTACKVDDEALP